MIRRTSTNFPNDVVERSAHTALKRLSESRDHLQKAEVKYLEASTNRNKREELLAQAIAEVIEAKRSERSEKARCDELRHSYSEDYEFYSQVLQAAGLTEYAVSRYFGDLAPMTFAEKKARA